MDEPSNGGHKKSLDEESAQRKIQIDREVAERKKELEFLKNKSLRITGKS